MSDIQFIQLVESCQFPESDFDHEAHVRLAANYYWLSGEEKGLEQCAKAIQNYATSIGALEKYHATVTYASYRLVVEVLARHPEVKSWQEAEPLLRPFIQDGLKLIKNYYSDFALYSDIARTAMLLPDIKPFAIIDGVSHKTFEWQEGKVPVLISMPHNGTCVPDSIAATMTDAAHPVTDTDWYLRQLYDFAEELGCYLIAPLYSRYVIDLNRPSTGESLYPGANVTELCPTSTFALEPLYQTGKAPDEHEIESRIQHYWQPYHQQLESGLKQIKEKFGHAILFEAHSIASQVPRFFDGQLPDFNLGTNDGNSCSESLQQALEAFSTDAYSKVVNGRFKGGFITRHYGQPEQGIQAVQLELSQATYMDEPTLAFDADKANQVKETLRRLLQLLVEQNGA
ncbi:N-formylglutamate deformylase [Pleionea sp. CnH1-48]|uniref:N-formylglutamate deformylase n=1 Tax=Pleionea sp. CnH1-48 TaxID=2954494 RepID=UPI002096E48A|nr:N-formylglutamate deformylase [Pleionea sp. CnH1-48]MCO7227145.1 N-formylglutamate deformylase [Pleionea sp. CnH1-48]